MKPASHASTADVLLKLSGRLHDVEQQLQRMAASTQSRPSDVTHDVSRKDCGHHVIDTDTNPKIPCCLLEAEADDHESAIAASEPSSTAPTLPDVARDDGQIMWAELDAEARSSRLTTPIHVYSPGDAFIRGTSTYESKREQPRI